MQRDARKRKVQVDIYGDNYTIKGDTPEEQMKMVAEYVDEKMQFIGQRNPNLSAKQIAVLAALNIADELYKLQNDYDRLLQVFEEGKN